jgi:GNAT superfamily N-acetyltransferase
MDETLRVGTTPDGRDIRALRRGIYEHNVASTGIEGDDISIFVRDADGELRGGLYGWTWSGWLEVNLLWVRADERGHGLGSRLLAAAEAEALARGCHTSILDTHSFQAPDFYRKHGYEVWANLDGYPTGHSKIYFRKRLA